MLASHRSRNADARPLVEDNASDAMVAQAAVERAAFGPADGLRAANLASALAVIDSTEVHLVLLDLNMPDSRGLVHAGVTCAPRCAARSS